MRTARLAVPLLIGLVGGAVCGCDGCGPSERDLWIVNNSGTPFSVVVDGKEVLKTLPSSATESPPSVGHVKVKPGDRFLEARFADGKKVVRGVMFSQQTSGYVFAPQRDKGLCFYVAGPDGETGLDRNDEVLGLPHVLDDVHTLRMKPCAR